MSDSTSLSVSDLGAVLIQARLQTSEVMSGFQDITKHLEAAAILRRATADDERAWNRLFAAAEFARSHLRSAAFSANCYFAYLGIFGALSEPTLSRDVKTAAIDAAHIHADVVPIELYNAREVLASPEFIDLTGLQKEHIRKCFECHFPGVKEARDAVAHSHDRLFARWRNETLGADIGGRPITRTGKSFLGSDGRDFLFDFTDTRFRDLLSDLNKMILQCA